MCKSGMPINKGLLQGSTGNEENQGWIGESEGLEKSRDWKKRAVKIKGSQGQVHTKGRYIPRAGKYQGQAKIGDWKKIEGKQPNVLIDIAFLSFNVIVPFN